MTKPRAIVAVVLLSSLAAAAHARGPFGTGQDLRLNGIVEPAEGANTLGVIKIRAGNVVRRFGVIFAQTPRAQGMSLFNRSSLHPEQLLLRGTNDQMSLFQNAPAGTTLRMLGRYQGDTYLLAEITTVAATPEAK